MTVPSASTTSSPRMRLRVMPNRITSLPPALVEMLPPILQDPLAPRSRGNRNPASSAASWMACKGVPARTVMVMDAWSSSSMPLSRSRESAISSSCGVAPPHNPVSPPCTTTFWLAAEQMRRMSETCAVDAGRATAAGAWAVSPELSAWYFAEISAPDRITSGPNFSVNCLMVSFIFVAFTHGFQIRPRRIYEPQGSE